ncbi:MAG TPA: chemotaxis protein CheB, partial [Candidatus Saccharimonadales bacterium]|nr:chemotaxis protein CheB [Candidatus Saccharimonadales bacterium]
MSRAHFDPDNKQVNDGKKSKNGSAHPPIRIVGIGASAGGLEAFTELLQSLPQNAGVAYVLVQHLDPTHRSLLSELLAKATTLRVREIADETHVEPDQIYVIPPNSDLSIEKGVLKLSPRRNTVGAPRAIDNFLKSLAVEQGEKAIGVILSGAGSDGAQGIKAIKEAGGITFAQDDASAKYDSMPRSAVNTSCVDFVLSPANIAREIARLIQRPNRTKSRAAANAKNRGGKVLSSHRRYDAAVAAGANWPVAPQDPELRKLFQVLRAKTGVDFSFYKSNTIGRRITRRLALHKIKDLDTYQELLRKDSAEIDSLCEDLLINVTSFFRNPATFALLKS